MSSAKFNSAINKLTTYKSYIFNTYMYKQDLALNDLQELICYKTKTTNQLYIVAFSSTKLNNHYNFGTARRKEKKNK